MGKTLRVLLWTAIVIGVIVGLGRAFAIRWWRIPENDVYLASSVSPTLGAGDLIVLWRLTTPADGDLVLCPDPKHPERPVIARIFGEEGDQIRVVGTRVFVNEKPMPVETQCTERKFTSFDPQTGIEHEQVCDMEVAGGRTHMRGNADSAVVPVPVEAEVPEGQVYLVSDNRQFPYDSRDFGPVERATCTETVVFRLTTSAGWADSAGRLTFIK